MKIFIIFGCVLLFNMISVSFAGLDQHEALTSEVIAIYQFEDVSDSGPKGHDLTLEAGATLTDIGKCGKGFRVSEGGTAHSIRNNDFSTHFDYFLSSEFSIVAWIRTTNSTGEFCISMSQRDEEEWSGADLCIINDLLSGFAYEPEDGFDFTENSWYIEATVPKINDGKWHHIGFTRAQQHQRIFVDGEVRVSEYTQFGVTSVLFPDTTRIDIGAWENDPLQASVDVDEVGLFESGLSVYEMQALYKEGLNSFLETMPVAPQGKIATTWGTIKQHNP